MSIIGDSDYVSLDVSDKIMYVHTHTHSQLMDTYQTSSLNASSELAQVSKHKWLHVPNELCPSLNKGYCLFFTYMYYYSTQ